MSELMILRELLKDNTLINTVPCKLSYKSTYKCILKEESSDYCLEITDIPHDAIIIKADQFKGSIEFFKGTKMECKRADYIIIVDKPRPQVLYIELKRSRDSSTNKEMYAQLKGAHCLFNYCKDIINEFWCKGLFNHYENRYYIFYSISLNKYKTYEKFSSINNIYPERPRIIRGSSIHFNRLIA
ncbi:MAG: hypothetical protein K0R00_1550 [Herbinix sp.]|jgi:hypothetical protein|nr:hypothetical protein [Herbinix sp.]